eukprot:1385405-Amorphochlora_amoeboformis.AAC.1
MSPILVGRIRFRNDLGLNWVWGPPGVCVGVREGLGKVLGNGLYVCINIDSIDKCGSSIECPEIAGDPGDCSENAWPVVQGSIR